MYVLYLLYIEFVIYHLSVYLSVYQLSHLALLGILVLFTEPQSLDLKIMSCEFQVTNSINSQLHGKHVLGVGRTGLMFSLDGSWKFTSLF